MILSDPRFLYMTLVLPGLFGLILIGEGVGRMLNQDWYGVVSFVFGILFILVVLGVYLFFSMEIK